MKIKNVYISPEGMKTQDFIKFRSKDIEKYKLLSKNVFTSSDFEDVASNDITKGLYGWDAVRVIHPTNGETLCIEIDGKLVSYHRF